MIHLNLNIYPQSENLGGLAPELDSVTWACPKLSYAAHGTSEEY